MIYTMNIIFFGWDYAFNSKYEAFVYSGEPHGFIAAFRLG